MHRFRQQFVLGVVACATMLAQVAPKGSCGACNQACCTAQAGGRGGAPQDSCCEGAHGCLLCDAAAGLRPVETAERPCDCQLNARHERPISPSRSAVPVVSDGHAALAPAALPPLVPQVLGVSREYLAASLAVPIRPPRILLGVWRN